MVLVLNIWSWSRSWRKSLGSFSRLVVILDGSEQGTPWHFVRDNKNSLPFGSHCLREPSALHAVERVFNNGGYLLGHTDTSKAQCIDCGKLLSLGSNKPGKQTVYGLKRHLEKCHKDIYTLYMRKVESRQQGLPAKKAKLDDVLSVHCRADLVTECMKKRKNVIRRLSFFGRKSMSIFVFSRKWNTLFGRPLVYRYITKRSWSWDAKSWFWTLGLVLFLKEF